VEDLEIFLQVWKELKPHLVGGDIGAAADDFVQVLIENGTDANEILTYAVDRHIKLALRDLADEENFEEEEPDLDEWDDEIVPGC